MTMSTEQRQRIDALKYALREARTEYDRFMLMNHADWGSLEERCCAAVEVQIEDRQRRAERLI